MEEVEVPYPDTPISELEPEQQARQVQWLITRLYATIAELQTKQASFIKWINEE